MFLTGVSMYTYILIHCNRNFFQNHKIIPALIGDYLRSGGDIYMIRMWMES